HARTPSPLSNHSLHLSAPSASPLFFFHSYRDPRDLHSFPTRRSSDLDRLQLPRRPGAPRGVHHRRDGRPSQGVSGHQPAAAVDRSEEHTSELQSQSNIVCRLLLEKKK